MILPARFPPQRALWGIVAGGATGLLLVSIAVQTSPLKAAAVMVGLVVAAIGILFPSLALGMTVLVIPIERLGRFTSDSSMYTFSLMRVVGLLALLAVLVHILVRRKPLVFGRPFFVYLGYCGIALLSITYTTDFLGTVRASGAVLANLAFFFLMVNMISSWKLARLCVVLWLMSSVLVGLYTIYDWHWGSVGFDESKIGDTSARFSTVLKDTSEWESFDKNQQIARASGTSSHPAVYGMNLILTLPFFAYFLRTGLSRIQMALVGGGLAVILYNTLLTNTRAVLLMVGIVLLLCVARGLVTVTVGRAMAFLVACAALLPFVPADVYERVLDPSNYSYKHSGTLRIRLEYWRAALEVAEHNWLLGVGLANEQVIPHYVKGFAPKSTSVHNEYLETLIEVGVIGWLLFFGFIGTIFSAAMKTGARLRRNPALMDQYRFMVAIQIAMLATLLFGVQVDVFHFPLKGWWLLAGITWAMYRMVQPSPAALAPLNNLDSPNLPDTPEHSIGDGSEFPRPIRNLC